MENFRKFSEQNTCDGGQCKIKTTPLPNNQLMDYLKQLNGQLASTKDPADEKAIKDEINRVRADLGLTAVKEQAGENIPALKQPLDIGTAAISVGGLNLEDGYLYYTINGKRPRSSSDIEKLATPGSVLRHHFKKGVNLNKMTDLINMAQQGRAIKSVTSQRAHPARAFFEAGLAFRMSPDAESNSVKLVVSEAPHLKRKETLDVAPGLPPQR